MMHGQQNVKFHQTVYS